MIKINKENETKPLAFNQSFEKELAITNFFPDKIYNLDNNDISVCRAQEIVNFFIPRTYIQILLISESSYKNFLTDIAALRRYDSSFMETSKKEIKINNSTGLLFVTFSNKLTAEAFLLEVQGSDLLDETITISNGEDFEFKKNKDLSKIDLKFNNVYKIINVKNS